MPQPTNGLTVTLPEITLIEATMTMQRNHPAGRRRHCLAEAMQALMEASCNG
jgi:hypothetical protein